jgi:hypothetical protein
VNVRLPRYVVFGECRASARHWKRNLGHHGVRPRD